ncbi:MAG TPA: MBOAT family O-acyltransferase [Burkholderiaceae bacterium]|nr:MBOAT family O-acyltransferase [Burkholderiaceae bacterium]
MSFVSLSFIILFAVVFVLYHFLRQVRSQNLLLLAASCIFYAWWDWRFLSLMLGLSLVSYLAALSIEAATSSSRRNAVLALCVAAQLACLAYFKYVNFFGNSLAIVLGAIGLQARWTYLDIVLPLAISFHTFQLIAYVVDVWRREYQAERQIVTFFAFSFFFPQLIAGPIERAEHLLSQFKRPRSVDARAVRDAIGLVVLGYAVKIVIADTAGPIVDSLFVPAQPYAWSVVLGTVLFGVQIYADFLGYSLIAKGCAGLLGFKLIWNFRFPYRAVSPSDFWRRWHISLSRWLRDYVYIPLGGNRYGASRTVTALMLTMILGGLWHGAAWNFVLWGLFLGVALATWRLLGIPNQPQTRIGRFAGWLGTMSIVFIGWFLFRATGPGLMEALITALRNWEWAPLHLSLLTATLMLMFALALFEYVQINLVERTTMSARSSWTRVASLGSLITLTLVFLERHRPTFIYFQF